MRTLNKKGGFEKMVGFAVAIATLVIIVITTLMVTSYGHDEITSVAGENTSAYNASEETIEGFAMIPGFLPIIILAGIGVVILSIIAVLKTRY